MTPAGASGLRLLAGPLGLLIAASLTGCQVSKPNGAVGFVVNQHASAAPGGSSAPGKSYTLEPCALAVQPSGCRLVAGDAAQLQVEVSWGPPESALDSHLGQTLGGGAGKLQLGGRELMLEQVSVTLQAHSGAQVSGNFNARVHGERPPWEVVGNFQAALK